MASWNVDDIKAILQSIRSAMEKNRDRLIGLDGAMGDGDLGITMSNAFIAADEEAQKSNESDPGKLLMKLGMVMAKAAPSTMGTLIGTGFMRGGKAISPAQEISLIELAKFFEGFTQGIMERGKSKPGDKTIVDVLFPASQSLLEAAKNNDSFQDGLMHAFVAAKKGLDESTGMKAQFGRAAYYQEGSIGKQDGGATVGLIIFEEFYNYTRLRL
ncbi:MAG TPA: dihydroxyacetone kinase subunit L [Puia sp.]|nr:dihydroxyacetone kinase subunit L [Puia sp.]